MIVIGQGGQFFCEECNSYTCGHALSAQETLSLSEEEKADTSLLYKYRRRLEPFREVARYLVEGDSKLTKEIYVVSKLTDGTFACTCPSFYTLNLSNNNVARLTVRNRDGSNDTITVAECKHIRKLMQDGTINYDDVTSRIRPASKFQKTYLFSLLPYPSVNKESFESMEHYTSEQAYLAINRLLDKHGIEFKEGLSYARQGKKIPKVPLISFGIEFEGGNCPYSVIEELIRESGCYGVLTKTYHSLDAAKFVSLLNPSANVNINNDIVKIVYPDSNRLSENKDVCYINVGTDSSLRALTNSFELKTGRCFGLRGMNSIMGITEFLDKLIKKGAKVNKDCGLHLTVGVGKLATYSQKKEIRSRVLNLALAYDYVLGYRLLRYLVESSRINNPYCKFYDETLFRNLMRIKEDIDNSQGQSIPVTPIESHILSERRYAINLTHLKSVYISSNSTQDVDMNSLRIEYRLLNSIGANIKDKLLSWIILHGKITEKFLLNRKIMSWKQLEDGLNSHLRNLNLSSRQDKDIHSFVYLVNTILDDEGRFYDSIRQQLYKRFVCIYSEKKPELVGQIAKKVEEITGTHILTRENRRVNREIRGNNNTRNTKPVPSEPEASTGRTTTTRRGLRISMT